MIHFSNLFSLALILLLSVGLSAQGETSKGDKKDIVTAQEYMKAQNYRGQDLAKLKQADALRIKTIKSIVSMTKQKKMTPERKFELYLRLGELYVERHDYIQELELRDYEARHDRWSKKGSKGKEPQLSDKRSKPFLYKAVEIFRGLSRNFTRNPRVDSAIFALATTLDRLGSKDAVFQFKRILSKHKKSRFLPESNLAIAEHYFEKQDYKTAEKYYKNAFKFKNSRVYTYSIYKLGWTYFNMSTAESPRNKKAMVDKSIASFKLVVRLSERDAGKRGINLKKEAINDLTNVFAQNQRTEEALAYFENIGENDAFYNMLEKLGYIYVDNGEKTKAAKIFDRLVREAPQRKSNPEAHLKLVEISDGRAKIKDTVKYLVSMNELYNKSSLWTRTNSDDEERLKSAKEMTRKNIHRYSTKYHRNGMNRKDKAKLAAALTLYNVYLADFSETKEAYELRFYLADIYYYFKSYDRAANEYYRVSQQKGKYLKKSATFAVASMKNLVDSKKYPKLPPLAQVAQPLPIPNEKIKYIKMLDNYNKLLPKDKAGNPMRYTSAYTFFEYGHYENALARFNGIVALIPSSKQGKASVNMVISYYSTKEQWDDLIASCRGFLKIKSIRTSKLRGSIEETLKSSLFNQAVRLSQTKQYDKSAASFVAYRKEFPKDKRAVDALYNAILNYFKAGNVESAITNGQFLISSYPKSKYVAGTILDVAQAHESLANFKEAAIYYEKFSKFYPRNSKTIVTLFNSATLYKGIKNYNKAIELYSRFHKSYPKKKIAKDALFEIAQLYEAKKDYDNAVKYYQKHAWAHPVGSDTYLHSLALSGEIYLQARNKKAARKQFNKLYARMIKKDSSPAFEARRIVARSMFNDIDRDFNRFQNIKFTNGKRIERDVQSKQRELTRIVKKYQKVIDLGSGEFTVASLYRVAEMNENFANRLLEASPPSNSTSSQADEFRSAMEKVAFPLKEEADSYFELAYKRSKEVQTFTNWTRTARQKMTEINREQYPQINEIAVKPGYLDHRVMWQQELATLNN